MSTSVPNFDQLLSFGPAFATRSQEVGKIAVEAVKDIVTEQAAAARAVVDFTSKALQPEVTEPAAYFAERFDSQAALLGSLGASAEKIFAISSGAAESAFNVWAKSADDTSEAA